MDSDSDDELMRSLDVFGTDFREEVNTCWCCDAEGARIRCSVCEKAIYCDTTCLRRHFAKHRQSCIAACAESEEEASESESESEDEEEENLQVTAAPRKSRKSKQSSSARHSVGGTAIALTDQQITQLRRLSASTDDVTKQQDAIKRLEEQVKSIQNSRTDSGGRLSMITPDGSQVFRPSTTSRHSIATSIRNKELRDLQRKLEILERQAAGGAFGDAVEYKPMLVKDDPVYKKYFKLQEMEMEKSQIQAKMTQDGVDPSFLETPDAVSPNDKGRPKGAYVPLKVREDREFRKYFKLLNLNMPTDQIKMKMEADGVDPKWLDMPDATSPNDPGPLPKVFSKQPAATHIRMPMPAAPAPMLPVAPVLAPAPYQPMLVKDDPAFEKYFKLSKMGMPEQQIKLKMSADGVDPELLNKLDEVSPNDPGPPPAPAPAASTGTLPASAEGIPAGMSMQQLYAMVMQHHSLIQSGGVGGRRGSLSEGAEASGAAAPMSVEDQMAAELAAAENAVDDIFGEEEVIQAGGMTMVQQLEKRARKQENLKLIENRAALVATLSDILTTKFADEDVAIKFYSLTNDKLEALGLPLGSDENQTWSARLLIKNKETKDWYFTEQERLNAGKAYIRMWSLSFLALNVEQISDKEKQVRQAPATLINVAKSTPDLIDRYMQLLKDIVKLKHKIFRSRTYKSEIDRMAQLNIPQTLDARGDRLVDSASVLVQSVLDLAAEAFDTLHKTTRGKKIQAHAAVHTGEKALQLINVVKKIGVNDLPEGRIDEVQGTIGQIKQDYLLGEEEEEEDDVL